MITTKDLLEPKNRKKIADVVLKKVRQNHIASEFIVREITNIVLDVVVEDKYAD